MESCAAITARHTNTPMALRPIFQGYSTSCDCCLRSIPNEAPNLKDEAHEQEREEQVLTAAAPPGRLPSARSGSPSLNHWIVPPSPPPCACLPSGVYPGPR